MSPANLDAPSRGEGGGGHLLYGPLTGGGGGGLPREKWAPIP